MKFKFVLLSVITQGGTIGRGERVSKEEREGWNTIITLHLKNKQNKVKRVVYAWQSVL